MALAARDKNILLVIIGQSNEDNGVNNQGIPILGGTVGTNEVTLDIGGFRHTVKVDDTVTLVDESGFGSWTNVNVNATADNSITVDANGVSGTVDPEGYIMFNSDQIRATYGAPMGTGAWATIASDLAKYKGYWMTLANHAESDTSFIEDWVGKTGTGDAITVYDKNDGGFDPNNFLSIANTQITNQGAFHDEIWFMYQHGQADVLGAPGPYDSTGATTSAIQKGYYQEALENMIDYFSDNTNAAKITRIYLATSAANQTAKQTAMTDVIGDAMDAVITADSTVSEGPKLHVSPGEGWIHNGSDNHFGINAHEQQVALEWIQVLQDDGTLRIGGGGGGGGAVGSPVGTTVC